MLENRVAVGTLESAYAERLVPGDRFVLDGRALEVRPAGWVDRSRPPGRRRAEPAPLDQRPPVPLIRAGPRTCRFSRRRSARRLVAEGPEAVRAWLIETFELDSEAAVVLIELFEAQVQWSEVPGADDLLVEQSPSPDGDGLVYTFHAPLHRAACEALGRATAARLGRRFGRNLALSVADLGWSIRLPEDASRALEVDRAAAVARAVRRRCAGGAGPGRIAGAPVPARRLHGPDGLAQPRAWPSRAGRRPALGQHAALSAGQGRLPRPPPDPRDAPRGARTTSSTPRPRSAGSTQRPAVRFRVLPGLSPFAAAWIEPGQAEALHFESAADALRRLHARLAKLDRGAGRDEPNASGDPIASLDCWQLTPEGAVIHPGERTAVIADLHLGYEWARGAAGDCVPAHSLDETLATTLTGA